VSDDGPFVDDPDDCELEWIDPTRITPPHAPFDERKLRRLEKSMRQHGWKGRPLLAVRTSAYGLASLTGSHRTEAARRLAREDLIDEVPACIIDGDLFEERGFSFDSCPTSERHLCVYHDGAILARDEDILRALRDEGFEAAAALFGEEE
jgi:hypothetical protein